MEKEKSRRKKVKKKRTEGMIVFQEDTEIESA